MAKTYIFKPSDGTWWEATLDADNGMLLTYAPGYVPAAPSVSGVTWGDIVRGALRLIGARAAGDVPSAQEMKDGLYSLNSMLASWTNEKLMQFCELRQTFPIDGSGTYTMGVGGDFDTARPLKILRAFAVAGGTEFEVPILTDAEWQERSMIGVHNDKAYPLAGIDVNVPNGVTSLTLHTWSELPRVISATDVVVLPPGYERAMRYGLAIEIAPEYEKEASPTIVEIYRVAKASIKRVNSTTPIMRCDNALVGQGTWNIATGGFLGGVPSSTSTITEVPVGVIDGVNAVFTLASDPKSLMLFKNGIKMSLGIGYSLTGASITYLSGYVPQPPTVDDPLGDTHEAIYIA